MRISVSQRAELPFEQPKHQRREKTSVSSVIGMPTKTLLQSVGRARRFALHLRVYYRELNGREWFEGWTENISRTGMLFTCTTSFSVDTLVELRLQLAAGGGKEDPPAEVLCKGTVMRVERLGGWDAPTALAVAIHPYRITRGNAPSKGLMPFA